MQQEHSAADAKLGAAGDSLKDHEAFQEGPDRLEHWATINGMKLNQSKSQVQVRFGEEWLE